MNLRVVLPVAFVATTLAWSPTPDEMPLGQALHEISSHIGAHVFTTGKTATHLVDLTPQKDREAWLEELERIAYECEAELWPLGHETYYLERQAAITMEFNQADIKVVLDLIARNAGASLFAGEEVEGLLSLNLLDVPIGRALDAVVETARHQLIRERCSVYRVNSREHQEYLAKHPLSLEGLAALGLGESVPTGSRTISLDEEGVPASKVLEKISKAAGLNVFIEDEMDRPVSISVRNLPWKGAVEAIARETCGVVWDEGTGKVAIRNIPRMSMEMHGASVRVVLDLMKRNCRQRNTHLNLVIADGVEGSCMLNTNDLPWRDMLYSLSRQHAFDVQFQDNVFVVSEYPDRDR